VADRFEQRGRLRPEDLPDGAVLVVRGGRDAVEKLRAHAQRTARAWTLDGVPLLGISVFAAFDRPLETPLRERFATFRTVHVTTVVDLVGAGFDLLATPLRPHFTVRMRTADDDELQRLLAVLGPARDNVEYGKFAT
jgi:hypothetical protein